MDAYKFKYLDYPNLAKEIEAWLERKREVSILEREVARKVKGGEGDFKAYEEDRAYKGKHIIWREQVIGSAEGC